MLATRVQHEFVELIPDDPAEATLYISIPYATAVHLCLCGCGHRVVTPTSPTDWRLIFDAGTVSVEPSIGNWSFECQSHYWIENGRAHWAGCWSQARIDTGRGHDRRVKRQYFGELAASPGARRKPATAPIYQHQRRAPMAGTSAALMRRHRSRDSAAHAPVAGSPNPRRSHGAALREKGRS